MIKLTLIEDRIYSFARKRELCMSQQPDISESATTQLNIDINFLSELGQEYIKADLASTLEDLKDGGQILQYSLVTDETDRDWDTLYESLPFIYDLGRVAIQVTTEIAKGISENKNTLDILTDLATIFGVTLPLVRKILTVLQSKRGTEADNKVPYTRITVGTRSIEVRSSDLKESEESALRLAERFLEKHPNAKASNKIKINSGLAEPLKPQKLKSAPRKTGGRKRSKKRQS